MAEITIKVPKELKEEIEKLPGIEDIIGEFLKLKAFELESAAISKVKEGVTEEEEKKL